MPDLPDDDEAKLNRLFIDTEGDGLAHTAEKLIAMLNDDPRVADAIVRSLFSVMRTEVDRADERRWETRFLATALVARLLGYDPDKLAKEGEG